MIEDLINLKRHQTDTKAVGELAADHSILEDVEDYINYDMSRDASDYELSSDEQDLEEQENEESEKVRIFDRAFRSRS